MCLVKQNLCTGELGAFRSGIEYLRCLVEVHRCRLAHRHHLWGERISLRQDLGVVVEVFNSTQNVSPQRFYWFTGDSQALLLLFGCSDKHEDNNGDDGKEDNPHYN